MEPTNKSGLPTINSYAKLGTPSFMINEGTKHPFLKDMNKVLELGDKMGGYATLSRFAKENRAVGDSRPYLPDGLAQVWLLKEKHPEIYQLFFEAVETMKFNNKKLDVDGSSTAPKINHMELYGRVDKTSKIQDIGSGNGFRMKAGGHEVTGYEIDMTKVNPQNADVVKHIDTFVHDEKATITSFNAMTQATFPREVEGKHGIHIFPDMNWFMDRGLARKEGDVILSKDNLGKERWKDRYYVGGSPIRAGYRQEVWFREMETALKGLFVTKNPPLKIHGKRITGSIECYIGDDCSFKYDGQHCRLWQEGKRAWLYYEDGRVMHFNSSSALSFDVELELVSDRCFVTRVNRAGDIRPHHTIDTVEKFVKAYKIEIEGRPLKLEPVERASSRRYVELREMGIIDGLVFKRDGEDHLVKTYNSVDVESPTDWGPYNLAIANRGFKLVLDGPSQERGVMEYDILIEEDKVRLKFRRKRHPNKRIDTPDDLAQMIDWPSVCAYDYSLFENIIEQKRHLHTEEGLEE